MKKRNTASGHYTHLKGLAIAQAAVCILEVGVRIRNGLTSFRRPLGPRPVYTTEKLGTDPTRKEYGPHIFARINIVDHVFWHGYGPVFFVFGFGAIEVYGPQTEKTRVRTSFLILTSACLIISLMVCAVL